MTQLRTGLRSGLGLMLAVGLLGMAGAAPGQALPGLLAPGVEVPVVRPSATPRTFGTASATAHVLGLSDLEISSNAFDFFVTPTGSGNLVKRSSGTLVASVRLPAGALVQSVELQGCDPNDSAGIDFLFTQVEAPNGPTTTLASGTTGVAATPGCAFFSTTPVSPVTIDNENKSYVVTVSATFATGLSVSAVRLYYTLQVIPAPAVATFADVSTDHPFFPFIEALAASGITVGCGGGDFCPDAPLTRGQMAVFLSRGLGCISRHEQSCILGSIRELLSGLRHGDRASDGR